LSVSCSIDEQPVQPKLTTVSLSCGLRGRFRNNAAF
jgi:hypothetical protein